MPNTYSNNDILNEKDKLVDLLFQNSHNSMLIVDAQSFLILDVNVSMLKMLGYENKKEVIGSSILDISPTMQEDKKTDEIAKVYIEEVLSNGANEFEWIHKTKNNVNIWCEVFLTHVTMNERPIIHALIHNIDEKKRFIKSLEKQNLLFRETQNLAKIGIWELDLVQGTLLWSDEVFNIFELDKNIIEPSYELFLENIYPDDRDAVNEAYSNSLITKEPYIIEHRVLTKNNILKTVVEQCNTEFDENGNPLRSIGTVQDVTQQVEINKVLENNRSIMIHQSRFAAMGEMIGNISHQWRQPLNALALIIQKIELLQKKELLNSENVQKVIEKSMILINNMSNTIDDFRDFFNPDKNKEIFEIVEPIDHAYKIIEGSLNNLNISFELNYMTPSFVNGYSNELSHVFINMFNNARDAIVSNNIEKGHIKVTVTQKDSMVSISVADNGGGMPQDIQEKVFDPYFTTKEEGKGTGIGLYMSKTIVEDHMGGHIKVNKLDDGTEFTICLALNK